MGPGLSVPSSRSPALVFVCEVAVSYGPMVPGWQLVALTRRCSQESLLPAAALLSPEPRMLGSRTREQCLPSIHCTHCAGQVSTVLYYRPGLSVLTASINRAQHSTALPAAQNGSETKIVLIQNISNSDNIGHGTINQSQPPDKT